MSAIQVTSEVAHALQAMGCTLAEAARAMEALGPALEKVHRNFVRDVYRHAWNVRRELGWRRYLSLRWWGAVRAVRIVRGHWGNL